MTAQMEQRSFSPAAAQRLVADLMRRDMRIYWADFLLSAAIGYGAFLAALALPVASPWFAAALVIAALAFYRAVIFIHELAHFRPGQHRAFRLAWNLLVGIPLLIPSFLYDGVHNDHHKPDVYGTAEDGEYLPFARRSPWGLVGYVLLSFILPAYFIVRFALLAPLSWLVPPLRRLVWARASSLTIDMNYIRPPHAIYSDRHWRLQEVAAALWALALLVAMAAGLVPWKVLGLWYAMAVIVFILNSLRTLAAHAYRNAPDHKLDRLSQFLDSVDIPGNALTTLWAPVGLRYHATHHLFPAMPYHNLGRAYRRLMAAFGEEYARATRRSLIAALARLWREAAENRQRPH